MLLFELEFEELFEDPFELELDELFEDPFELELDELLEDPFELELDELLDDRFELELLELLELRLPELAPLRPRRSPSSPTLRAAVVRPRSQALKKPCTGVRARRSVFSSSACAAVVARAPTIAAVTKAVYFVFMLYLSCVDRQKMEVPRPVGTVLRDDTGLDNCWSRSVCTDNGLRRGVFHRVCKHLSASAAVRPGLLRHWPQQLSDDKESEKCPSGFGLPIQTGRTRSLAR